MRWKFSLSDLDEDRSINSRHTDVLERR